MLKAASICQDNNKQPLYAFTVIEYIASNAKNLILADQIELTHFYLRKGVRYKKVSPVY